MPFPHNGGGHAASSSHGEGGYPFPFPQNGNDHSIPLPQDGSDHSIPFPQDGLGHPLNPSLRPLHGIAADVVPPYPEEDNLGVIPALDIEGNRAIRKGRGETGTLPFEPDESGGLDSAAGIKRLAHRQGSHGLERVEPIEDGNGSDDSSLGEAWQMQESAQQRRLLGNAGGDELTGEEANLPAGKGGDALEEGPREESLIVTLVIGRGAWKQRSRSSLRWRRRRLFRWLLQGRSVPRVE